MTYFKTAAAALPSTRRKRFGDGMLKPVDVLEFRNPQTGRVELMRPSRDRVSADWWGYKKHPELFMPANRDDTPTIDRHRETLERARRLIEREIAGTTRATSSSVSPL